MRKAKQENGKSHADITTSTRTTFFPVMLKRNHVLDVYTKRGGQDMVRDAELLSEQRPVPPSSRQLAVQQGHVNEKLLHGGGSTDTGQGEGRKGNICEKSSFKVKWKKSQPRTKAASVLPANQHAPPSVLLLVSLRWQGGDRGKGLLGGGFLSAI